MRLTLRPKRVSRKGLEFIAREEGFVDHPYNDPAGHATIGFGHLLHHGNVTQLDRTKWGVITRERGLELLREDSAAAAKAVADLAKPWRQTRFDALTSFTYNVGVSAFSKSTLLRRIRAKKYAEAANEFLKWNKAGGRVLPGLTLRRKRERNLYLNGKYQ